jgi:hypothetical protein
MEAAFGAEFFTGLPNWIAQLILPAGFSVILCRFVLRAVGEAVAICRRVGA